MAKVLLTANSIEICLAPMMIKGKLISTIKTESSIPVMISVSSDKPIAPPSRKSFGNRNSFKPILAIVTPIQIKIKSLMCRV